MNANNPLFDHIDFPVIVAPMFIVSTPEMVIESCCSGLIGSFVTTGVKLTP